MSYKDKTEKNPCKETKRFYNFLPGWTYRSRGKPNDVIACTVGGPFMSGLNLSKKSDSLPFIYKDGLQQQQQQDLFVL